jgi:uncharacterized DUF497 family protein
VVGETDRERRLVVVFTPRGDSVRVVTGFTPNFAELRTYRGRRGK